MILQLDIVCSCLESGGIMLVRRTVIAISYELDM